MTRIAPAKYTPDVAVPPGETIRETLVSMGMTQAELAQRMGRSTTKVNEIIQGKTAITVEAALALENILPYPASFWLNLEKNYRLTLARLQKEAALEDDIQWMRDTIPVGDILKRINRQGIRPPAERLKAVLEFFAVGSVAAWKSYWGERVAGAVAFRRSLKQAEHVGRVAAWLRLGELKAQGRSCQPFNKRGFQAALKEVRLATAAPPKVFEPLLESLSEHGVVVLLVKEIPGAGVSGATWWSGGNRAHIQLSLRYKADDQFWFTFFHEAGHVLLHGKGSLFLEGESWSAEKAKEDQADRFAADFLIPPGDARKLAAITTKLQVIRFAEQLGIAPVIVAGRLHHDHHVTPQTANYWGVKQRLDWQR